ncbi:transposase [Plastoroseomonas arctica]|uniref:Transposase n=1 Tax=Plastoroseomonas arctica TaxID=1509237 RepID=A0AAF1KI34_9PROT|nr:transposase [Plastoroseomonas arctica]MBR0654674.1 transposase [Plastoroseomonas arctica]
MQPAPRYTPRRPAAALTDAEWAILAPHFTRADHAPGRPLSADARTRMDAFLHLAVTGAPWRAAPAAAGKPNTVARHFVRLAEAGLWSRLLEAVAKPNAPPGLRAMDYWICRLARRAMRVLGMRGLALARRLGRLTALPMLPWFLPDPDLSQTIQAVILSELRKLPDQRPPPGLLAGLGRCLRNAAGRATWSRQFAPP